MADKSERAPKVPKARKSAAKRARGDQSASASAGTPPAPRTIYVQPRTEQKTVIVGSNAVGADAQPEHESAPAKGRAAKSHTRSAED
jgi:hypothetical protein